MVHALVISTGSKILRATVFGAKVEGKFWQQFWKHPYDKAIRASVLAGSLAGGTVNYEQGDDLVDGTVSQADGTSASKPNKAYSGRKSNTRSGYYSRNRSCKCNRYAHSRKYKRRSNRKYR